MKKIFKFLLIFFSFSCENENPYSEGMHWNYSIDCENGYVFKIKSSGLSSYAIQVFNSDGTPLKCGEKIY